MFSVVLCSYDRRLCWFDLDLSVKPYKTLRSTWGGASKYRVSCVCVCVYVGVCACVLLRWITPDRPFAHVCFVCVCVGGGGGWGGCIVCVCVCVCVCVLHLAISHRKRQNPQIESKVKTQPNGCFFLPNAVTPCEFDYDVDWNVFECASSD